MFVLALPETARAEGGVSIAGTLGLGQNQGVPGETEASALSIGYRIDVALTERVSQHRFGAKLAIDQAYSYSFVAASPMVLADDVVLSGSYRFLPTDFFGIAMEGEVETSPLGAVYVSPRRFSVAGRDGPLTRLWPVSDPFEPTSARAIAAAALFAKPLEALGVDFLLGVSHVHTWGDALVLTDQDDGTLSFTPIRETHAFGPAARFALEGNIDRLFFYEGEARVLLPAVGTTDDGLFEGTACDLRTTIALRLTDWLEVRYRFRAGREPLRSEPWTLENDAVLAFMLEDSIDGLP